MDAEIITDEITAWGHEPPARQRLELLCGLAAIYEREGVVVDNRARPLWRDCPDCRDCWAALPSSAQPENATSGVSLPWVGSAYRPGGIATVGINLYTSGGLFAEYEIAAEQLERLMAGDRRQILGGPWAYRTASCVAVALSSAAGRRWSMPPEGQALAEALDASTRLQTVKCSPQTRRSVRDPSGVMDRRCPNRYLRHEMAVLQPGTVIAFGYPPWAALDALADEHEESISGDDFSRAVVRIGSLQFELFWLHHPSGRGDRWNRSFELFAAELDARPLRAAGS